LDLICVINVIDVYLGNKVIFDMNTI